MVEEGAEKTSVLMKKKKNVNFVGLEDDSGDSYGEEEDEVVELPVVDAEEVDGEDEVVLPQAKKEVDPQEQDEMSLTRATKVLEGTTWADLATTKVRFHSRCPAACIYEPIESVLTLVHGFRFSLPPISPRSTSSEQPPPKKRRRTVEDPPPVVNSPPSLPPEKPTWVIPKNS